MTIAARNLDLARLQAIADRTGRDESAEEVLPLGLPAIDRILPDGGLRRGALHEIEAPGDDMAGIGFALALAARAAGGGPILWCQAGSAPDPGPLYGPGLRQFGLSPAALLVVRPAKPRDVLWAMEEGLRAGTVAAIIGQGVVPDMIASRRLQLAARMHGRLAILVLPRRLAASPSSAETRWTASAAPSAEGPENRLPRWRLTLRRCRRGRGGDEQWHVHWDPGRSIFVPG
ncbi:ImuA family protein [Desertibaculum subflavum]|uniref:ImuA family protein n=1 Tax=Desertibaculum subflavum TaxID=2268458 RepID=UPI000E66E0B5